MEDNDLMNAMEDTNPNGSFFCKENLGNIAGVALGGFALGAGCTALFCRNTPSKGEKPAVQSRKDRPVTPETDPDARAAGTVVDGEAQD